jgi:hypothetical protein
LVQKLKSEQAAAPAALWWRARVATRSNHIIYIHYLSRWALKIWHNAKRSVPGASANGGETM